MTDQTVVTTLLTNFYEVFLEDKKEGKRHPESLLDEKFVLRWWVIFSPEPFSTHLVTWDSRML